MKNQTLIQKFKDAFYIAAAGWLLAGCTALPFAERQANATTEVSEKWSRDQTERIDAVIGAMQQKGEGGTMSWTVDSRESGNGDQSLLGGLETNIPGGIKLVAFGVGILVFTWAVKVAIGSSRGLTAFAQAADSGMSKVGRTLEGMINSSSSEKEKANLMSLLKDLESERGKLK